MRSDTENEFYMNQKNLIISAAAVLALSAVVAYLVGNSKSKSKTRRFANEGYELAGDILFPNERIKSRKLKFGPVLPV